MNLSKRNTHALVRGLASASRIELEAAAKEVKTITCDTAYPLDVRLAAKDLGVLVRKQIRRF